MHIRYLWVLEKYYSSSKFLRFDEKSLITSKILCAVGDCFIFGLITASGQLKPALLLWQSVFTHGLPTGEAALVLLPVKLHANTGLKHGTMVVFSYCIDYCVWHCEQVL